MVLAPAAASLAPSPLVASLAHPSFVPLVTSLAALATHSPGGIGTPSPDALALWSRLFPRGTTHYLVGGTLVGLGIAVVYLGTGIMAGNSTVLETTLSYVSDRSRFNRARFLASRDWRVVFAASFVVGAAAYALLVQGGAFVTAVPWWRLLAGGVLVGVGTRLGKGCTAGHGVCGLGSRSRTSAVNVALFVLAAIGTALLVGAAGGFV